MWVEGGGVVWAEYSSVVVVVFVGAFTHRHCLLVRFHKTGSDYFGGVNVRDRWVVS